LHIAKKEDAIQLGFPGLISTEQYLCRSNGGDSREIQAERYAAYLLMPRKLILQEIDGLDLTRWPNLYKLRDAFKVSITAMTKRLTALGLIAISGKTIYRSSEEAHGGMHLF
jgi:Zn-dependent peptidase ImmA (M78 family)